MNTDILEGKWEQLKGKAQQQWGKLTSDDLDVVQGNAQALAGKIQERYGIERDEAEKQVEEWSNRNS
ncbi:MAG: CsbD family protein [Amphritea sp.]|nr:CsbD family protein [Amphritea sp.]